MNNEKSDEGNNPWKNLNTVKSFDRGTSGTAFENVETNRTADDSSRQVIELNSSHISLFLQSFVKFACKAFKSNTLSENELFYVICEQLCELKIIDDSYIQPQYNHLRHKYHSAITDFFQSASNCENPNLNIPRCVKESRYANEFEELDCIASGASGTVYKAKNRLDHTIYAIKKIYLGSNDIKNQIYHKEVSSLAKLNHPNIIPYKTAWIESIISNVNNSQGTILSIKSDFVHSSEDDSSDRIDETSSSEVVESSSSGLEKKDASLLEEEISGLSIEFADNDETNANNSVNITESNLNKSYSDTETDSNLLISRCEKSKKKYSSILYIQMYLGKQTLKEWLENTEKHEITNELIHDMVTQILKAVDYIHKQNVVHHDIKPCNIIVKTNGSIRLMLSDFGLACITARKRHRSAFGTPLYAAPEQLQKKCNPKSDLYSVGVVLLNILLKNETVMEVIKVKDKIKQNEVPEEFENLDEKLTTMTTRLLQENPEDRPSASELLDEMNMDKDSLIAMLRKSIKEKDLANKQLERELKIAKRLIQKNNISSTSSD